MLSISVGSTIVNAQLETEKNFVTIIGTAFASLIAFYFRTRGTQVSTREWTTPGTERESKGKGGTSPETSESGQNALECIHINPTKGSVGVEIGSQVMATFSAPVRNSSISSDTFSVEDH